jgi:hypothetical protein
MGSAKLRDRTQSREAAKERLRYVIPAKAGISIPFAGAEQKQGRFQLALE